MRILVTGGAGYIGSVLVGDLLRAGHDVDVVDNFLYRQWSLAHLVSHPRLRITRADVRDISQLRALAREADALIPLAGIVGAPACARDPEAARSINQDAPLRLFGEISSEQWILMPTTNSAYGSTTKGAVTDENSPLVPLSDYAKQKVAVEQSLMERKNSISFRLATVFGISPRMRLDLLVNDFTYRAVTDRYLVLFEGHFRRNYIHVGDVARVFSHGLQNFMQMRGEIYNVGISEANLTKRELCEKIQLAVPDFHFREAPLGQDPDRRDYEVSNAKLEATGWRPQTSLEQGIRELIRGYSMLSGNRFSNLW